MQVTRHRIIRFLFVGTVFVLFAMMFWPFFTALLLAGLFAFALNRYVEKLTELRLNRAQASVALITSILIFVAAPLAYIILKTVALVKEYSVIGIKNTPIYQSTEQLLLKITEGSTELAARFSLDLSKLPKPVDLLSSHSDEIGTFTTGFLAQLPLLGLNFFVFLLALFYFLSQSVRLKNSLLKLDVLSAYEINLVVRVIQNSSHLTLIASVLIGLLQAFIVSVFAYFCGFTEFFIIFIMTAITSLIPVVGSAPMALFLMLVAFIQGQPGAGLAMLVAAGVAGSVDNFIKPLILNSGEQEMHPVLSLLSLIGAIMIYGAPGILLGPVITQLALNTLPIFKTEEKAGEIAAPE